MIEQIMIIKKMAIETKIAIRVVDNGLIIGVVVSVDDIVDAVVFINQRITYPE